MVGLLRNRMNLTDLQEIKGHRPPLTRRRNPPRPQSWHGSRRPIRNINPHLDDLIGEEITLNVLLFRPLKSNSCQRKIGL